MHIKEKPVALLAEDEKALSSIIADTLEDEGFATLQAFDGHEGLRLFLGKRPDIVITDVMMPRMDGFEMLRRIRKTDSATPVLFLTARASIEDLVAGFELGANDYLRKPFKMQELIVRVKALLHRTEANRETGAVFYLGHYVFDSVSQTLVWRNETERLSHLENEILKRLCRHINHIVPVRTLLLELWNDDSPYSLNGLHGYIHKLRKFLQKDERVMIINERGIGYKLVFTVNSE
ncbi:MAG: response regulator transcription factor [Tannerellaceae bacterium]|jgi:DNA-binding response OmpR family regulator|nr:response regulator transcription factor [Tannerellaceae bacterium]